MSAFGYKLLSILALLTWIKGHSGLHRERGLRWTDVCEVPRSADDTLELKLGAT